MSDGFNKENLEEIFAKFTKHERAAPLFNDEDAYERAHGLPHLDTSRFHIEAMRVRWQASRPRYGDRFDERRALEFHTLVLEMNVRDIYTGKTETTRLERDINDEAARDPKRLAWFVRTMMADALQHEADECFVMDGKQVRDPHENELPRFVAPVRGSFKNEGER